MKSLIRNLLLIGIAIVLGILILFKYLDFYTLKGETIMVPKLIGYSIMNIPKESRLNYKINDSIFDKSLPKGIIVNQFPKAFSEVKPDRTILLTYNKYVPSLITIPKVIDNSVNFGLANIEKAGFKIGKIDSIDNEFPIIISLHLNGKKLSEGEQLEEGSEIDVSIGKGIK